MNSQAWKKLSLVSVPILGVLLFAWHQSPVEAADVTAHVVALDQKFYYNRLGVVNPAGMIFALRRDVVNKNSGKTESEGGSLSAGNVALRIDKRPRPLVLRVNEGDTLVIHFQNLLDPMRVDNNQPNTRTASVHVMGLQLVGDIGSDGSNVGENPSSLVEPGGMATYRYRAVKEGAYLLYSSAATVGGEGDGGSLAFGLFGAVNVEPPGAEWYRAKVTEQELRWATTGLLASGHPVIDYDARYPVGHRFAGLPILKMLNNGEIVHSDLDAVITGPGRGNFPAGVYRANRVLVPASEDIAPLRTGSRSRNEPFREFTSVWHDEIFAIQAFPGFFNDEVLGHTLSSVRDSFAINYGTGGIGSEILGNRLGVGPMANCVECKYEEFFLTSWVVGDPAMVVDVPANRGLENLKPNQAPADLGPKATRVLYPDDPSNVHHSYLGDHVKFRNVHAGPKEHHIFHLHAHQWLFNPEDSNSAFLDSQAIGPGSNYTYEIAHNGSGNRNLTPGDAIFHCHFYPHFAQGMWALLRNHDVFEMGTVLDADGRPAPNSRALPDGEIPEGIPIPAVVPLPGRPMPPMPGTVRIVNGQIDASTALEEGKNPGFPFYIAGVAGHRPTHPPLDKVDDGGLPRHLIVGGTSLEDNSREALRLDFSKELVTAHAVQLPEEGTPLEKIAMDFHARRFHPSFTPEGQGGFFKTNGRPPVPGAPFADPCVDDRGRAPAGMRTRNYKIAAIQLDVVMNKVGWHFPQSRILALWGDVAPTLAGSRPPEPLFFRANTNDCLNIHHTNLVPHVYEQDDFQVRTPTDIIGQHIHLVKFDVTASDGAANGFNYEDGTFAPGEVQERIHAIKGGSWTPIPGGPGREQLQVKPHPFFGSIFAGAQTTIQRWYVDDVINNNGRDNTLRTVFTHDHFAPSTHQQAGLYASLVVQPRGSTWRDSETGRLFGSRFDGGPTSWKADILTPNRLESYREFLLQFSDFKMAYDKNAPPFPGSFPESVINPPARKDVGLPLLLAKADRCPGGFAPPCPEAVSSEDVGTFTVNYRNEPLALRVLDTNPDPATNLPRQAEGDAGDLSFVYRSDVLRSIPELNVQPARPGPLSRDVRPGDPFTPILRAYEGDRIQIRVQVGAHEEGHNMTVHGIKWLQEPASPNSGYRNSQMVGISEHFEMITPLVPVESGDRNFTDRIYQVGASMDDQWNGAWGILRAYARRRNDLRPLPGNPVPLVGSIFSRLVNQGQFRGVCPRTAPLRTFDVTAVAARDALPGGTLIYNSRMGHGGAGPLHDPTALMYVRSEDLGPDGTLREGVPVEPLILRANAGDCIEMTLRNRLPEVLPDLPGFNILPMIVENFNANQVSPSNSVGLHPQLLAYDASRYNGVNVGLNSRREQTARPGGSVFYRWYAGDLRETAARRLIATPVEFGATGLIPSDPIKHSGKGLVGALIIEPVGATWVEDAHSRASALVSLRDGTYFREFVLVFQDDVNMRFGDGSAIPNHEGADDPEDSGQKALNYRTEPMWFRVGFDPDTPFSNTRDEDFTTSLSNSLVGGDPETPVFTALPGDPVRFRVVQPGGHPRNSVFALHGHSWQRQPYVAGSTRIGSNPLSQVKAAQEGIGPSSHFDMVLMDGAGGNRAFPVEGDYLYRNQTSFLFSGGQWGILRVQR